MQDWPPADIERTRAVLVRAVGKTCPSYLADRREDIVQDALIRVLKVKELKESGLPSASYLWKAAYSATIDEIRRHKRRQEDGVDGTQPLEMAQLAEATAGSQSDPELKRAIQRELAKLKPARRSAVVLQLCGFSLQESAKILDWPEKRVDNHRYLGMSDLRRALKEQGFER